MKLQHIYLALYDIRFLCLDTGESCCCVIYRSQIRAMKPATWKMQCKTATIDSLWSDSSLDLRITEPLQYEAFAPGCPFYVI